jgi:hypothetical protein
MTNETNHTESGSSPPRIKLVSALGRPRTIMVGLSTGAYLLVCGAKLVAVHRRATGQIGVEFERTSEANEQRDAFQDAIDALMEQAKTQPLGGAR